MLCVLRAVGFLLNSRHSHVWPPATCRPLPGRIATQAWLIRYRWLQAHVSKSCLFDRTTHLHTSHTTPVCTESCVCEGTSGVSLTMLITAGRLWYSERGQ